MSEDTLTNITIGSVLLSFKEIDSTNEKAHSLALQGIQEGTVIIADRQTKGRGRRGRHWHSPEGGLYCSMILRPKIPPNDTGVFEKMAGIVLWETIAYFVPEKTMLKVPNDILIDGRKVAGILIEAKWRKERLDHIIIGIGINCRGDLGSLPKEMHAKATSLSKEKGCLVSPSETLDVLILSMNKWYKIFLFGDTDVISNRWKGLLQEGRSCRVTC